jgi:transcription-repair coupling factor (superfamily II helicase)
MHVAGLLAFIQALPQRAAAQRALAAGPTLALAVLEAAKPALIAALYAAAPRPLLIITPDLRRARHLVHELPLWLGPRPPIALFPPAEARLYERLPDTAAARQARMQTLEQLALSPAPTCVVVPARALIERLPAPQDLFSRRLTVAVGATYPLDTLLADLVALGYEPADLVTEPGTFAHRGGIVDVFPPADELPLRIEFFGDTVESLRRFEPGSQRTVVHAQEVTIGPPHAGAAPLGRRAAQALASLDLSTCRPEIAASWAADRERLARGEMFAGAEFYTALVGTATLLDYLPAGGAALLDEPNLIQATVEDLTERAEASRRDLVARGELPDGLPRPYWLWPELMPRLASARLRLTWQTPEADAAPWAPAPLFSGRIKDALAECQALCARGERIVICSHQAPRMAELLAERGVPFEQRAALDDAPPPGRVTLLPGGPAEGWRMPASGLTLLTDAELFGWAKRPTATARRTPLGPPLALPELEPGMYVVHVDHGIGRFVGLVRRALDGQEREYLAIEYAEGDKLYVPTDQAERVSRYLGPQDTPPTIHRLGSGDWLRTKLRARRAAQDIAQELLDLYAAREAHPGYAFSPDTPWQAELEAAFPYLETPDQARAIAEVKADMEQPKPMDRLLCGDVGYGKTEVALRAAFKAVQDGKQVAVLVPTTVLAQQHFETFRQRLAAFPVRVELLSRFRSPREQQAVLAGLKDGQVDICIGTHRLLQKDVAFRNLGLVVIDEEHRFGVMHKEQLKRLRREVDVLALSATPIPRSLYLALSGLREMSTMETPPEERLPIKTYIAEYDDGLVRDAIRRELERGGQVFFVHNRVHGIGTIARHVQRLVPEARLLVAHGQMPEEQLEQAMLAFAAGEADVLVCTTIIESGLDLPNANTIIVNNAHRFGLAQLYQLRGRVGRSATRAYAYLLFPRDTRLNHDAERRLRTMFEANELGAGFRIALRDLEIRGAGNLLGAEQHGHVAAVGFDLYCRMLAEAVQTLRGQPVTVKRSASIDLPLAAHLPASYVADPAQRLNLYQRLANAESLDDVGSLGAEIRDRFGPPPRPVLNLLYLVQLKVLAQQAGVQSISARSDGAIVLELGPDVPPEAARAASGPLGHAATVRPGLIRLDRTQLPDWQAVVYETVERLAQRQPAAAARA